MEEHLCECGCGQKTGIATVNNKTKGWVKGQPYRFVRFHNTQTLKKHGHAHGTKTYRAWDSMVRRCTNPKHSSWDRYGGRGITVCDRWIHSFENFLADMGVSPEGMTLERVNNELGYSPQNCAWKDNLSQQNNRGNNKHILYQGQRLTYAQLSRLASIEISVAALQRRLKLGWPIEKALSAQKRKTKKFSRRPPIS